MHSVTSSLVSVSNNQSDSLKLPCYCCRWLLFGRAGFSADVTAGQLGHGTDEFGFRMLQDASGCFVDALLFNRGDVTTGDQWRACLLDGAPPTRKGSRGPGGLECPQAKPAAYGEKQATA